MASPPYSQSFPSGLSVNYTSHLQHAQPSKRRQPDIPSSAPVNKRRKSSIIPLNLTTAAHPLRQTSFPPEMAAESPGYSRSPSIDRMSVVSGPLTTGKKKKPRKSKGKEPSSVQAPEAGAILMDTGRDALKCGIDQSFEDEEEEVGQELAINAIESTKEERLKEERRRHLLTRAFNQEQWQRYEAWRSSKLSDSVVRRIVNQTLSQSAPQQVILAVRSVAKIFAGDIIERSRKVQTEWLEITGENPGLPVPNSEQSLVKAEKEKRRGPLMPDHLREAFRRHILTDQGLVGQLGLWQQQQQSGVERFGVRIGGKRLFK
ncbi:unnamed protein product [Blumeria hordei]|uniref:TAFII28-like protein domain-containing protein n=2 Tax=Blumeria hordei TaxID=2867405 RepID=A0A383UI81_BLUHO|nr:hypothetical protein BGHDH14_bgh05151 [Blumeria hordei DH14]SZF00001.1 unnamed protein product [Blumeria hordei]